MNKLLRLVLFAFLLVSNSCTSVKAYQKMYLYDMDMQLSDSPIENFEVGFQTYREGVSGGNGGKTGGGCGCN